MFINDGILYMFINDGIPYMFINDGIPYMFSMYAYFTVLNK